MNVKTWLYYKFTTALGASSEAVLVLSSPMSRLLQRRLARFPREGLRILRGFAIPATATVDAFACAAGDLPEELACLEKKGAE